MPRGRYHPGMKTLLALFVLCLSAFAQSGTVTLPTTTTSNSIALAAYLPPPDPGKTQLQISVDNTWYQTCTVTSTYSSGQATARWGNTTTLRVGSLTLSSQYTRNTLSFPFGNGTYGAAMTHYHSGVGATFSLNLLTLFGPLYLDSTSSSTFLAEVPLENGTLSEVRTSVSTAQITYMYL